MTQMLPARGNHIPSKQDSLSVLDEKWRYLELHVIIGYEADLSCKDPKDNIEGFPEDEESRERLEFEQSF